MDFEMFQIRRFTTDELEEIFQNRINSVFYPEAVINVEQLKCYWFVDVQRKSDRSPLFDWIVPWGAIGRIDIEYTKSRDIQHVLQQLALFDWSVTPWEIADGRLNGWDRFHIPCVLRVHYDLLLSPHRLPYRLQLETEPDRISLDDHQTEKFKAFIERIAHGSLIFEGKSEI